jgi:hypothetical protein
MTPAPSRPLFPFVAASGWGYMNRRGDEVVPPRFEACLPCFEHRAAARQDGRYAFFDERGRQLSDFEFEAVDRFSGGRCAVRREGVWRYVDSALREIFRIPFRSCGTFHNGLAVVYDRALEYHYVDPRGKTVLRNNATLGTCGEGLVPFRNEIDAPFGYKRRTGGWALKPRYLSAGDFAEGLAVVKTSGGATPQHAFITPAGTVRVRTSWDFLLPRFAQGRVAFVAPRTQRFGFLTADAEVAIPPDYDTADAFVDERALVTRGSRGFFIDRAGEIRVELGAASAGSFRHGLVWVATKSYYAYLDPDGRQVWRSSPSARAAEQKRMKALHRRLLGVPTGA